MDIKVSTRINIRSQCGVLILIILAHFWQQLANQRRPPRNAIVYRQLDVIVYNELPIRGAYFGPPAKILMQPDRVHTPFIPQKHSNTSKGLDLGHVPPSLLQSWVICDLVGAGADHDRGIRHLKAKVRC
jgi:hypothetical protein